MSRDTSLRRASPVRDLPGAVECYRTIASSDVASLAACTGADNRIHMDATYAATEGLTDRISDTTHRTRIMRKGRG
jgi:acyl dehydratase